MNTENLFGGKLMGHIESMTNPERQMLNAYNSAFSQAATTAAPTPGGFVRNKHGHYFKDTAHLNSIDVYRVLELFNVTNPSIAHATKKLLVAGGRGAGKSIDKDIQEAIDSLVRWQAMRNEDRAQDDLK